MLLQLPKGYLSFVERWPLMNPNDVIFIIVTYLIFVLKIGPFLMARREPFKMKGFLILYNIIKITNSSVLAYKFLAYVVDKGLFPRKCEHDDRTMYIIAVLYWKYMATKILDLFDTVFFVLRKKSSQITFLHVYHHVFMVVISWSSLKYDPSDHWAFMAVVNCTIHAIMYTYYGLSAMGPTYAKYLWWKKYLTLMQLIQFKIIILHIAIQTYTSPCPMSMVSYWVGVSNLAIFMGLFTDFYRKNYRLKSVSLVCNRQAID
ncbi:elongation of very long chain fatty acids protein 4-like [Pararge aegeria]|uniref:elongation of very long chain fatty acids protein 4-like n=1 Tax=Pararge aegeria TaxID=116150 RepID=UPI0019D0ACFA|nr:elongation of very long chain fatty acids protein 4-like [Pararge aegeria]